MQQVTTLLHVVGQQTLLCVVGQQCYISLYGPKSLTDFELHVYATSASIVVVPCKQTQYVGPNNVASICIGLKNLSLNASARARCC